MYAERAAASGSRTDADKAMENFKAAVKADPSIPVTNEELSGEYKLRPVKLIRVPPPPPIRLPAPPASSK